MDTRERVLTIRLAEKIARCPEFARRIGIELVDARMKERRDNEKS